MTLRVAFVPGVTPAKWFRIWDERFPRTPLEVVPLETVALGRTDALEVLHQDAADVAFARFPIAGEGVNAIPLYSEVPVVVLPKDHDLTLQEELALDDVAGERMLEIAETPTGGPDAVELVSAGVGALVLPKSLARLWSRRDVESRPLTDGDETRIAIVWRTDLDEERAALVEEFIGIVRGRTANSSRADTDPHAPKAKATAAAKAKAREAREAAAKKQPAKKKKATTFVPRRTRKPR
ncbi:LysR substrate-binding domain-containing protein [Herbiconiux solani]|uniref:LysR substrate-binding domain-containing protein n=1 Tax=Herbiconiux solani TaxID=661329 RepID=UPI00082492CC|nr:LysR substrate-binding domain-containing protein [Herbiconiux solani]